MTDATNFSRTPRLLRGAIVGFDMFNPISSVAIFQYNPTQLSRSVAPQYSEAGEGRSEPMRLAAPPRETITAQLTLDLTDQLEEGDRGPLDAGLNGYIAALEMLIYPKALQVALNEAAALAGTMEIVPPLGPLTLFVYGPTRILPVKMQSLDITETAHTPNLNPIRADVSVSMQVLNYTDLPMSHPGYWAFMAHQVVKETLASVASVNNTFGALGVEF